MNLAHHSLQFVCKLLMAAIAAAALLPGMVHSKAPPGATSTLLLIQALSLSAIVSGRENLDALCIRILAMTVQPVSAGSLHAASTVLSHGRFFMCYGYLYCWFLWCLSCRYLGGTFPFLACLYYNMKLEYFKFEFEFEHQSEQAVVVAAMEENLFAGVHEDGGDDMYPAVFVVLTSALGLALTRKLQAGCRVGVAASWLAQCIYVAKLSMLAIPEVC